MRYRKLTRDELLAAEVFRYSYANYSDHGGNLRFDQYMPDNIKVLEQAAQEKWPMAKLAEELEVEEEHAMDLMKALHEACKVIDVPNPSESFREAVRQQLRFMLKGKEEDEDELEKIVVQMCYCAADLGCLLEWEGSRLNDYSDWLRRTPDCDYTGIDLPNLASFKREEMDSLED